VLIAGCSKVNLFNELQHFTLYILHFTLKKEAGLRQPLFFTCWTFIYMRYVIFVLGFTYGSRTRLL